MGVLADRLEAMRVRALAPGGGIGGELRGRDQVHLSFPPGRYHWFNERELEQQLAGLGRLLWAGRMKKYYAAVSEAFGEPVSGESPPISPRDQDFYAARAELTAEGISADGLVRIQVCGMREWTVRIANGTIRRLTEEQFTVRVQEAATALIRDQFAKIRFLKDRYYG